jgi:hypothetical protein
MKQFFGASKASEATISAPRATGRGAQHALSAAVVAACALWAHAQAATVAQVRGDVRIERSGGQPAQALRRGQRLAAGDALVTPAGAEVFVRMDDGGALAIREGSRLQFDELPKRFRAQTPPQDLRGQSIKLTIGALRYVTGMVGKRRPEAIRFTTPTATIGIRGTDLDVVVREVTDVDILPGTYVQVNSGGVVVQSVAAQPSAETPTTDIVDALSLALGANESGFVGEPLLARGGRRASASVRKLEARDAPVFKRSNLDRLFR